MALNDAWGYIRVWGPATIKNPFGEYSLLVILYLNLFKGEVRSLGGGDKLKVFYFSRVAVGGEGVFKDNQ